MMVVMMTIPRYDNHRSILAISVVMVVVMVMVMMMMIKLRKLDVLVC